MIQQAIANIAEICARKHVTNIILSPGSRCAPLTISFARHPKISIKIISDERSAAFIALGIAQQTKNPVGLVCTSGSATYNYAPAVAEAFFQNVPLIVFTADRPPEWIGQQDGQAINQLNIYANHIKKSFQLPVSFDHPDAKWHAERIINEAINISLNNPPGPVHINVPLREPLYPATGNEIVFEKDVKIIEQIRTNYHLSHDILHQLTTKIKSYDKILVVAGQSAWNNDLANSLQIFTKKSKIPLVADVISNLRELDEVIVHQDIFLTASNNDSDELKPQLLITFGGSVISKNLKVFLRQFKPVEHWHIQESGDVADTFKSLTKIINTNPVTFFNGLNEQDFETKEDIVKYNSLWQSKNKKAKQYISHFFDKAEFGEFEATYLILKNLPECNLHISNSMPVRYVNLLSLSTLQKNTEVNVNRGTSGIDGSNSTAVGAAMATGKLTVLLTGDMAFFYDRNAFWHNYKIPNLKIILLNNHAGGIFRLIDGPSQLPELEEYFETFQPLNGRNLAQEFGFEYVYCEDRNHLSEALTDFFSIKEKTAIMEVKSSSSANHRVFELFKKGYKDFKE